MEDLLKRNLCFKNVKYIGEPSDCCVSNGRVYDTDRGKIFVKSNEGHEKAKIMFNGESVSLNEIMKTKTIRVPKPLKIFEGVGSQEWIFVMEHLDMSRVKKYQGLLGEQLAHLHLHNLSLKFASDSHSCSFVGQFGFPCDTSCGFIAMPNTWKDSWIDFYIENRLQVQVDLLDEKFKDTELKQLWAELRSKVPRFFEGVVIEPALLHGDLWSGNAGENKESPMIFDPASFYGHHEFDLAIAGMYGGFTDEFYHAYHRLIPKAAGFASRHQLYLLFHYLNHWNHFGAKYQSQSISLMKELIQCRIQS